MGYIGFELEESKVEYVSYTKYFEEACPIYMSYGLSYEDFWHGDPYKAKYMKETYQIKLKQLDEQMWIQGMYIYAAIGQMAPILHPFSKSSKPLPYTEKPFSRSYDEENKEEGPTEQEIENERLKAQIWIKNWARNVQKQMENK